MTRPPKLSLVAQYDDLRRNERILTQGIETEFERFVRFQEDWRKRLLLREEEKQQLIARVKQLEKENISLETQLKHARGQIDKELKKRRVAEAERQSLDQQIGLVRDLLNDKDREGFLDEKDRQRLELINSDYTAHQYYSPRQNLSMIEESCSLLSDADISYDKTEEDLETSYLRSGRPWKRNSSQPRKSHEGTIDDTENHTPDTKKRRRSRRRHRRSRSANAAVVTTRVSVDASGMEAEAEVETDGHRKRIHSVSPGRRTLRKCNSADPVHAGSSDELNSGRNYNNASPRSILRELNRQVTPPSSGTMRRHNSGNNLNRPHNFHPRTLLRPGGETCIPCGKRIDFGNKAVKCKGCNVLAHPKCKDDAPLPCIACNFTPSRNEKNVLGDFAPQDPPYIPAIVIHCINEVEERGLTEQGIYRVPGSKKEVQELKEKFFIKNKGMPCLTNVRDINVLCSCLKSFLKELKEPLVTYSLRNKFVSAAELPDNEEAYSAIYQAVSELPRANRDTLAFLVLHLQKVCQSPATLMNINSLSDVFGPTVVGYSSAGNDQNMFRETAQGSRVMSILMSISEDYWRSFIKEDEVSLYPNHTTGIESPAFNTPNRDRQFDMATPDTVKRAAVYESMLGPITTPTSYNESRRGWMNTPRSVRGQGNVTQRTQFFASPVL